MRRRDREVTDLNEIRQILDDCQVVHIGLHDGDGIYILPMNYGYTFENGQMTLYIHGSLEGKKWDLVRENPHVSFELDGDHQLIEGGKPCQYAFAYVSIMGQGKIEIIEDPQEKIKGLQHLMHGVTGKDFDFTERLVTIVTVAKITVSEYTAKQRPVRPYADLEEAAHAACHDKKANGDI